MYEKHSPWFKTPTVDKTILDLQVPRYIYEDPLDEVYVIEQKYDKRPDLFSYDRYGTSKYWWIFAQRNKNTIKDPVFDFTAGTTIRVPSADNISRMS